MNLNGRSITFEGMVGRHYLRKSNISLVQSEMVLVTALRFLKSLIDDMTRWLFRLSQTTHDLEWTRT